MPREVVYGRNFSWFSKAFVILCLDYGWSQGMPVGMVTLRVGALEIKTALFMPSGKRGHAITGVVLTQYGYDLHITRQSRITRSVADFTFTHPAFAQ